MTLPRSRPSGCESSRATEHETNDLAATAAQSEGRGLLPRRGFVQHPCGCGGKLAGEERPAIYCFTSAEALVDGLQTWLGEMLLEEESLLSLIEVSPEMADQFESTQEAPWEARCRVSIPLNELRLVIEDIDSIPFDELQEIVAVEPSENERDFMRRQLRLPGL